MNQHLVAAGNHVLGSTNFLILSLPEGWRLFTGLYPAEVDNSTQVREVRWVTNGRASYFLHSGQDGGAVELELRVGQGEVKRWLHPLQADAAASQLEIGGHQALYRLRPRQQSWFSRRKGDILEVVFYCEVTGRTFALEFNGAEQDEPRQALLDALRSTTCH